MKIISPVARLLVALLICGGIVWARDPEPNPIWKADARQFGYESFPRKMVRPVRIMIDFTDNDHLAVNWVSPDTTSVDRNKQPKIGAPAHLHIVILDAKTGLKEKQLELQTPYGLDAFVGLPDGKFVTCTGNSLQLDSSSLENLQTLKLPSGASCPNAFVRASPSRRTLLLSTYSAPTHLRELNLVEVQTLKTISSWTESWPKSTDHTSTFSDSRLAGFCREPRQLCLRSFDGQWRPYDVEGLEIQPADVQGGNVSFLEDDVLAVGYQEMTVVRIGSGILFRIAPPQKHLFRAPVTSVAGGVFAVVEDRLRGMDWPGMDLYPFAADDAASVYRTADGQRILTFKLEGTSPWPPWHIHDNAVALSPNGRLFAIISDSVIRMYEVPDLTQPQH